MASLIAVRSTSVREAVSVIARTGVLISKLLGGLLGVLTSETTGDVLLIMDRSGVRGASPSTKGIGGDKTTLRDLCIASRVSVLFSSSPCSTGFI